MGRSPPNFSHSTTALVSCKCMCFDAFDGNDVKICAKQKFFNRSNSDSCNFGLAFIFLGEASLIALEFATYLRSQQQKQLDGFSRLRVCFA